MKKNHGPMCGACDIGFLKPNDPIENALQEFGVGQNKLRQIHHVVYWLNYVRKNFYIFAGVFAQNLSKGRNASDFLAHDKAMDILSAFVCVDGL